MDRIRERAQRWWEDVRGKGEFALLAERVRRGDDTAVHQARLLVDRYPQRALGPLVDAVKRSGPAVAHAKTVAGSARDGDSQQLE